MANVKVRIDSGRVNVVVGGQTRRAVMRASELTARRAGRNVLAKGRVRTGALARSFRVRPLPSPALEPRCSVGSDLPYAIYQEKGVAPFSARPGRYLVFVPKGGGKRVFAKHVRGFAAGNFLRDAVAQLKAQDFAK